MTKAGFEDSIAKAVGETAAVEGKEIPTPLRHIEVLERSQAAEEVRAAFRTAQWRADRRREARMIKALVAIVSLGMILAALLAVPFASGQQEFILSPKPSTAGIATVMDYSGTNLIYLGKAPSPTPWTHAFSVATCATTSIYWPHCSQMTNIVDAADTATVTAASHGMRIGDRVCVTGATDADLNVCAVVLTTADANTWTMASSSVTDATYTTGVIITTRAPRTTEALWTIFKYTYDGSNNLTGIFKSGAQAIWANRATTVVYY